MTHLTTWMITLTLALSALILAVGASSPALLMAASGAINLVFVYLAVREHAALMRAGANRSEIGSSTARHVGLVWAWGGLGILATYSLLLQQRWPEWKQFVLGFVIAGAASLLFALMLSKDAKAGKEDVSMLKFGRLLLLAQVVGMAAALISLFVDGKFPRDVTYPDWAACNIFFFGALGIAAISLNALLTTRSP